MYNTQFEGCEVAQKCITMFPLSVFAVPRESLLIEFARPTSRVFKGSIPVCSQKLLSSESVRSEL